MSDNNFGVSFQAGLNAPSLPIPKDDIPFAISTTDPFSVRRESDLTGVARN